MSWREMPWEEKSSSINTTTLYQYHDWGLIKLTYNGALSAWFGSVEHNNRVYIIGTDFKGNDIKMTMQHLEKLLERLEVV